MLKRILHELLSYFVWGLVLHFKNLKYVKIKNFENVQDSKRYNIKKSSKNRKSAKKRGRPFKAASFFLLIFIRLNPFQSYVFILFKKAL